MALPRLKVAACHFAPVLFNAISSCGRALEYINRAAARSANLVVFPESAIPGFPVWSALLPPTETHDFFHSLAKESLYVDGDEITAIRHAAARHRIIVSLGFSEKVHYSTATLFNSNVLIGEDGEILVHHRKLVPTFFEKVSWSPGDGHGLRVANTRFGKIGALICGENTNPLARYALMAQGEQIHISTWPAIWPTRPVARTTSSKSEPPGGIENEVHETHDVALEDQPLTEQQDGPEAQKNSGIGIQPVASGSPGEKRGGRNHRRAAGAAIAKAKARNSRLNLPGQNYDNLAANHTRISAHCFEAKCFGISCAGFLDATTARKIVARAGVHAHAVERTLEHAQQAHTAFFDPTGKIMEAHVYTKEGIERKSSLSQKEDILYTTMELDQCVEGKQYHDVVGGYQRFDVFSLMVNRQRYEPAVFVDNTTKPTRGDAEVENSNPPEGDAIVCGDESGGEVPKIRKLASGAGGGGFFNTGWQSGNFV